MSSVNLNMVTRFETIGMCNGKTPSCKHECKIVIKYESDIDETKKIDVKLSANEICLFLNVLQPNLVSLNFPKRHFNQENPHENCKLDKITEQANVILQRLLNSEMGSVFNEFSFNSSLLSKSSKTLKNDDSRFSKPLVIIPSKQVGSLPTKTDLIKEAKNVLDQASLECLEGMLRLLEPVKNPIFSILISMINRGFDNEALPEDEARAFLISKLNDLTFAQAISSTDTLKKIAHHRYIKHQLKDKILENFDRLIDEISFQENLISEIEIYKDALKKNDFNSIKNSEKAFRKLLFVFKDAENITREKEATENNLQYSSYTIYS